MRNLGRILTWVKGSFCLLLLCWARYLIRVLFSGEPLRPMVDLLLNFREFGEVPDKRRMIGEVKKNNKVQSHKSVIAKALKW